MYSYFSSQLTTPLSKLHRASQIKTKVKNFKSLGKVRNLLCTYFQKNSLYFLNQKVLNKKYIAKVYIKSCPTFLIIRKIFSISILFLPISNHAQSKIVIYVHDGKIKLYIAIYGLGFRHLLSV